MLRHIFYFTLIKVLTIVSKLSDPIELPIKGLLYGVGAFQSNNRKDLLFFNNNDKTFYVATEDRKNFKTSSISLSKNITISTIDSLILSSLKTPSRTDILLSSGTTTYLLSPTKDLSFDVQEISLFTSSSRTTLSLPYRLFLYYDAKYNDHRLLVATSTTNANSSEVSFYSTSLDVSSSSITLPSEPIITLPSPIKSSATSAFDFNNDVLQLDLDGDGRSELIFIVGNSYAYFPGFVELQSALKNNVQINTVQHDFLPLKSPEEQIKRILFKNVNNTPFSDLLLVYSSRMVFVPFCPCSYDEKHETFYKTTLYRNNKMSYCKAHSVVFEVEGTVLEKEVRFADINSEGTLEIVLSYAKPSGELKTVFLELNSKSDKFEVIKEFEGFTTVVFMPLNKTYLIGTSESGNKAFEVTPPSNHTSVLVRPFIGKGKDLVEGCMGFCAQYDLYPVAGDNRRGELCAMDSSSPRSIESPTVFIGFEEKITNVQKVRVSLPFIEKSQGDEENFKELDYVLPNSTINIRINDFKDFKKWGVRSGTKPYRSPMSVGLFIVAVLLVLGGIVAYLKYKERRFDLLTDGLSSTVFH